MSTALFSLHSVRVLSLMALAGHLYHFAAGTGRESLQGSRDLLFRSFQIFTVFDVSSCVFLSLVYVLIILFLTLE